MCMLRWPRYPLQIPLKLLLEQAWRNLSDLKPGQLLGNDVRFRRFLGVGLSKKMLGQNTL